MRLPFRVLPPPRLLTLSLVAAALVGIIRLELRQDALDQAPGQPVRQQSKPPLVSASQDRSTNQDGQYVTTILARPLFSPNRRPPPVAAASNHDTPTELVRLTGVIVSPDGKIAIFAGPAGGKPVVVGEGARISAYLVRSIAVNAVTVTGPEGQRVLHPAFDPNPPPKPVTPTPTGAPMSGLPRPIAQPKLMKLLKRLAHSLPISSRD